MRIIGIGEFIRQACPSGHDSDGNGPRWLPRPASLAQRQSSRLQRRGLFSSLPRPSCRLQKPEDADHNDSGLWRGGTETYTSGSCTLDPASVAANFEHVRYLLFVWRAKKSKLVLNIAECSETHCRRVNAASMALFRSYFPKTKRTYSQMVLQ